AAIGLRGNHRKVRDARPRPSPGRSGRVFRGVALPVPRYGFEGFGKGRGTKTASIARKGRACAVAPHLRRRATHPADVPPMASPLRILFVATDATPRLVLALQQGGLAVEAALADTPDALAAALAARPWDALVAVDAEVPASAVLAAVRASQLALPVVVVSEGAPDAFAGAAAVVPPSALDQLGATLAR